MINIVIDLGLLALLLGAALVILRIQSPLSVVILTGIYSLALCTLFVVLDAVDVAFTEAAVGAGISTILFLAAIRREDEKGLVPTWPSTARHRSRIRRRTARSCRHIRHAIVR